MRPTPLTLAAAVTISFMLAACTSKDQAAATAAAQADVLMQQGQYTNALRAIRQALATRDDVSDYWLTLGRIDLALKNPGGAFDAYRNAIEFDRSNVEALQQLTQLGLAVHQPDQVDHFADQLLSLNPQDLMAIVMKGGAALQRNDTNKALAFAERVFASDPHNVNALILKAQVFASRQDYIGSARLIEESLAASSDQTSRLEFLRDLYQKSGDIAGYQRAIVKLAQAHADDRDMQLAFADLLYQTDHPKDALRVLLALMRRRPTDIKLTNLVVELWLDQGKDAVSPSDILAAESLPLEPRAAFAQFANMTGRPELAVKALGNDLADAEPDPANSSAKAAAALATGLSGQSREGLAQLHRILDVDAAQPWALLARARLRAVTGNTDGALSDARQVIAGDPQNITARLVASDILLERRENVLSEANLREAIHARPEAVRPVARLAELLVQSGRRGEMESVLRDLARVAPTDLRARRLLAQYHVDPPRTLTTAKGAAGASVRPD